MKKQKPGGKWNNIVLEVFCGYRYMHKKWTKLAPFDPKNPDKEVKWKRVLNCCYVKARIPTYCPRTPSLICMERKCPFFGYTEEEVKSIRFNKTNNGYTIRV